MSPVIRVSDEIYSRLEKHAVGFDNPSSVIERLLNHYEENDGSSNSCAAIDLENSSAETQKERLYTNREIQERISAVARTLPLSELEELCNEQTSKDKFGISFPLFVRVSSKSNQATKRAAVKTSDGVSRWTWKFEFEKEGEVFAVCTQWYPKNDVFVQKWLDARE